MASLWVDRLAEVGASPGRAGAGVVVGADTVLTARHVLAGALTDSAARCLARVVRPGRSVASWAPMQPVWDDEEWDLALLRLDSASEDARGWEGPESSADRIVVVDLGTMAAPGCEAVGFPESAIQHARGDSPAEVVRQTEQAVGMVLPVGQAKRPVDPDRVLPRRWLPLDIETTTANAQAGWGGMSGAGVVLPDGRLIGIVVAAESGHDQRRLYLVPLAAVLAATPALAQTLGQVAGRVQLVEAREAPLFRRVCELECLGDDGVPKRIQDVVELGAFGVKPADVPGEPPYLEYAPREDDDELRRALREATGAGRMLLVVGGSAAGKSRSMAEVVRDLLPQHRLIRPRSEMLAAVCDLGLAELGPAVVWLDDVQQYAPQALRETLKRLLQAGLVVIGTIRRAELDLLAPPGDVRNPAGEALTDGKLVHAVNWRLGWTLVEQARLAERVSYPSLLEAVAKGTSPGAYVVAGPLLVRRLNDAQVDEEHPCNYALVRTVLDWYRTGIAQPIPIDEAVALLPTTTHSDLTSEQDEINDALEWATTAVIGAGRRTRQSLISRDNTRALLINDYLIDHDQRHPTGAVPGPVWRAALKCSTYDSWASIATAAYQANEHAIAVEALGPLADAGNTNAMVNLGVLLSDSDAEAARRWYEQAVAAGNTQAMVNLGVLLSDSDAEAARRWYEQAAAAGNTQAMNSLGFLFKDSDPEAARRWYEQAAAAGNTQAMNSLGFLFKDSDPEAARRWCEQAAAGGNIDAMLNLSRLLLEDSDAAAARRWYEQAAAAGNIDAMNSLGLLLKYDDPDSARCWFEQAAAAGNTQAMFNLGLLLKDSEPEAARRWYEQAAAAGDRSAMLNLGQLLSDSDPEAARQWYEHAAAAGDIAAAVNLGLLLKDSEPDATRRWREQYEAAAAAGNTQAMVKLGLLLKDSDPEAARRWYEQAAAAGDSSAMLNLGLLLKRRGDLRGAKVAYQTAIDSKQAEISAIAAFNLGELLSSQRDVHGAKAAFETAINSRYAEISRLAAFYLTVLVEEQWDVERARAAIQRAGSTNPKVAVLAASLLSVLD